MKCPYCQSKQITVIKTMKFDTVIIRVRFCSVCKHSFQTAEQIQLIPVKNIVIDN